jgi:hypothetical protein
MKLVRDVAGAVRWGVAGIFIMFAMMYSDLFGRKGGRGSI